MQRSIFPLPLYIRASFVTSCVAMLFGLDTGTIGSVTSMPSFQDTMGPLTSTTRGVIVSSILLPGALAALVAGVLADRYGRKALILSGALAYGVGAALECSAVALGMFVVGRLVKGIGQGLFLSTVYVQVSETAPAHARGALTSLPQFLIVCGLVVGFFMAYGTAASLPASSSAAWRVPLGVAACLAFVFAALNAVLTPPSPRWLLARGDTERARTVVAALGLSADEQRDLLATSAAASLEHPPAAAGSVWAALGQLFAEFGEALSAPYRVRTALGCFVMAFQQFSGIDGVLYYAPVLFAQAGITSSSSGSNNDNANFLASGVSSLVILATSVVAAALADRWGRRTASLVGGALIAALMLVVGSMYAAGLVHATSGAGRWVVIVCIYLFAIVYSGTWALSFRTFLVESLPRRTRSSGSALGQCANWLANYVVALTTPVFIDRTSFGCYFFFAACTMLCTGVCAVYMVETGGQTLEEIEERYAEGTASPGGLGGVGSETSKWRMRSVAKVRELRGTSTPGTPATPGTRAGSLMGGCEGEGGKGMGA